MPSGDRQMGTEYHVPFLERDRISRPALIRSARLRFHRCWHLFEQGSRNMGGRKGGETFGWNRMVGRAV